MISIRAERPRDHTAVYEVNKLAFGQPAEAELVEGLRRSTAFIPELSLVACDGERVVGHILFTRITIESPGRSTPALALAPMAVLPTHQRRGIGSMLVREGLDHCRRLGHGIVVLLGHAEYYPRFGFTLARPLGIVAPFPVPDEAFMVLELTPGALEGVDGTVRYPAEFDGV
jgi:putative acetyltransferase